MTFSLGLRFLWIFLIGQNVYVFFFSLTYYSRTCYLYSVMKVKIYILGIWYFTLIFQVLLKNSTLFWYAFLGGNLSGHVFFGCRACRCWALPVYRKECPCHLKSSIYLSIYLSIFLYVLTPEGYIRGVQRNQVLGLVVFFG